MILTLPFRSRLPLTAIEMLESRIAPATVLAVTDNNTLLRFDHLTPSTIDAVTPVIGLGAGETLWGVDFQPFTGELIGLTVDASGTGRFYTIEPTTGVAELVSTLSAAPEDRTDIFTALRGERFSWDFGGNESGELRLISDAGQNLRVTFSSGLVRTDATLAVPGSQAGDPAPQFSGVSPKGTNLDPFWVVDTNAGSVVQYIGFWPGDWYHEPR